MSDSTTVSTVNRDGFTEDDVAARQAAMSGNPLPNDHLIMQVRETYRQGEPHYVCLLGIGNPANRNVERRNIERCLAAAFPTSDVIVDIDEGYRFGVRVVVTFPK
jgi:hypothetical protein